MSGIRTPNLLSRSALIRLITTAALAVATVAYPAGALAQGSGGGDHGGGTGETQIPFNLSFPTIWSDGAPLAAPYVEFPAGTAPSGTLDPTRLTVWVPDPGNPGGILYPEGAADPPGSTNQANFWQAENVIATAPVHVSQIDWGDNIEGTAVGNMLGKPIHVETTLLENLSTPMQGYIMYHISGSRDTEVFGTDGTPVDMTQADVYSECARLTIQRLDISRNDAYVSSIKWDPATSEWTGNGLIAPPIFNGGVWAGSEGSGYSSEINRSGSVVYGYNWQTAGLSAGDYRLTFSLDPKCPISALNTFITPETTILPPTDEAGGENTGGAGAKIDAPDNLSYIDVELGSPSYRPYVPPAPQNTAPPVISGKAAQGQILSATDGTWVNEPTGFAYQWQSCDAAGLGCTDIAGATSSTYTLTSADVGHRLRIEVTARNAPDRSTSAFSEPTAVVVPLAPVNLALPTILGVPKEGHTLFATNGSWDNAKTYAYQWQVCDATGAGCADIAGANAGSYLLTEAVVGHAMRVVVTTFNEGGPSAAATSPATRVIAADQMQSRARLTLQLRWMPGTQLHLWGFVYPPHNGRQLMVQERTRTGWRTAATVRLQKATTQRSRYTITLANATPGFYRAYLAGDAAHVASTSAPVRARALARVTLQLRQLTRDRLRLAGSVFPVRDGQKVMLQLRTHSGWRTITRTRLMKATRAHSRYSLILRYPKHGIYRARYGGDSTFRASNSASVTVR